MIPRKSRQYIVGAGYGTSTGVRGTLGVTFRRLNKFGHRFTALVQAASEAGNSSIIGTYSIPGRNPAKDLFTLSAGVGSLQFETNSNGQTVQNKSTSAKISASYSTGVGDWQQVIALTALDEDYQLPSIFPPNVPEVNAALIYPSISWNLVKTDNPLNPKDGYTLSASLAGTPDLLTDKRAGGFFQIKADANFLHTFRRTHTRLLLRASFGQTVIASISQLPLSLQLFAGGANSIRGFDYNSIGPGRNLFIGSVELQQRIYHNWYLGAFIDAGDVSMDTNPFQNFSNFVGNLNVGVGPSLTWLSPIGALAVSLGTPVSDRKLAFSRWLLQISLGPQL